MKNKRSHYAKALEHGIFKQQIKERKHPYEDDAERRFRKYHDLTEIGLDKE